MVDEFICVHGADAQKLLQAQLATDFSPPLCPAYVAYINRQGKILVSAAARKVDQAYYLRFPTNMAEVFLSHIKRYAVFSQVNFSHLTTQQLPEILQHDEFSMEYSLWLQQVKAQGIVLIYTQTSACFYPHELNYLALGLVSLTKGCYLGQEIVARLHYRAKVHNQLFALPMTSVTQALQAGMKLWQQDQLIATVADCSVEQLFLVLPAQISPSIIEPLLQNGALFQ